MAAKQEKFLNLLIVAFEDDSNIIIDLVKIKIKFEMKSNFFFLNLTKKNIKCR